MWCLLGLCLFSFSNAWTLAVGFVVLLLFDMLLSKYAYGIAGWVGLKLFDDALLLQNRRLLSDPGVPVERLWLPIFLLGFVGAYSLGFWISTLSCIRVAHAFVYGNLWMPFAFGWEFVGLCCLVLISCCLIFCWLLLPYAWLMQIGFTCLFLL